MSEKNWLHYYKNSLIDSENLAIDIAKIKNLYHQNNSDISNAFLDKKQANELIDAEERRINRLRGILKKDNSNWKPVEDARILIAPFHLEYQTDNPKFKQKTIHPFWINAVVNRLGQLSAPRDLFPLVVRNYVTPIADIKNDFIFSSFDTILDAKEIEPPIPEEENEPVPWDEYWDYINEVFSAITYKSLNSYKADRYTTQFKLTYFSVSSKISTAKSILFLYENLLNNLEELPLLSKITNPYLKEKRDAITDTDFLNYNHLHLGQMSNQFPLSVSQRKTLLSYLAAEESAVTAVNGPPGTGKTTLLQSLVATEVVKSAIIGEEPPIVLACSNNNQAVTNIIDSFINAESSMEGLAHRWIPDFKGYATYLPSNSKSEKYLGDINFLKGNLFGHEGTLCNLENETYLNNAEYEFLTNYCNYFNVESDSLEDAIYHLQDEIIAIEDILIDSVEFSSGFLSSIAYINEQLLHKKDLIEKENFKIAQLTEWRTILSNLKVAHKNPDFISQVSQYFYADSEDDQPESSDWIFKTRKNIIADGKKIIVVIKELISNINIALQSHLKLKDWRFQYNVKGFPITSEEKLWESEFNKLHTKDTTPQYFYDELDVTLRHRAFLLATHYWEGRWLLATREALEEDTEKGTGEHVIQLKWKRRAMLTPCFVATFYMAPSHFVYSQFQGENENGRPIFDYLPLYNFLDLLIIDEAGQVTPEVSIPVFALAKKAFVIGDLKQIEPIWSIPQKIDVGNLSSLDMLTEHNYEQLEDLGFLASNGCIMKMAQNACEYETPIANTKEQGLILLEHRRCNDEIINFCNELAYGGILKPMKGKAKDDQVFPSMVAYHVEGVSERKYNSRCNIAEVKAIITWLQQNKEAIQEAYNVDSIESVLGIITPFASQKGELSKALIEAGFKVNQIKLGTVHALQGAERSIILFSSVYTNEDEGTMFFEKDNKPNMLNVSVSRAKDSFILFGDTRIFDETKNTPSGVLKKHLNVYEMVQ
ncbi:DEAD/DEAH box helicase [Tenacibaculum amylolyticum]|uniref:DEAD/DEAH box helicase n=1 Tax=Tenacibaculum amylolyticum TaxID=104269 RepID=UPI0038932E13